MSQVSLDESWEVKMVMDISTILILLNYLEDAQDLCHKSSFEVFHLHEWHSIPFYHFFKLGEIQN